MFQFQEFTHPNKHQTFDLPLPWLIIASSLLVTRLYLCGLTIDNCKLSSHTSFVESSFYTNIIPDSIYVVIVMLDVSQQAGNIIYLGDVFVCSCNLPHHPLFLATWSFSGFISLLINTHHLHVHLPCDVVVPRPDRTASRYDPYYFLKINSASIIVNKLHRVV